jgi:hypothetical protein
MYSHPHMNHLNRTPVNSKPYTLYNAPYTLHPTPYRQWIVERMEHHYQAVPLHLKRARHTLRRDAALQAHRNAPVVML